MEKLGQKVNLPLAKFDNFKSLDLGPDPQSPQRLVPVPLIMKADSEHCINIIIRKHSGLFS
jgi:hypothetical protein